MYSTFVDLADCVRAVGQFPPRVRPHQWFSAQAAGVAGGALDALELEDESSDGGGGVATAQPGRRRSTLSESLWQRAAAEGAGGSREFPTR